MCFIAFVMLSIRPLLLSTDSLSTSVRTADEAVSDSLALPILKLATPVVVPPPSYLTRLHTATPKQAYIPPQLDSVADSPVWSLTEAAKLLGVKHVGVVQADVPGRLLGYSLRTDSWVAGALLLTFFLAAYTITRSRRFLRQQFKDFFRLRRHTNLFANAADHQSSSWFYLLTLYSLVVTLIYFDYMATQRPERLEQASPYAFMGVSVAVAFTYNVLKQGLYAWVGHTFFEQEQRQQWSRAFALSLSVEAMLLFVLLLLTMYAVLAHEVAQFVLMAAIGLVWVIRWYKQQAIFFGYSFGYVHGILYFCTLEVMPLMALWYSLQAAEAFAVAYL